MSNLKISFSRVYIIFSLAPEQNPSYQSPLPGWL
uniref:Uncharacterized protein n=1 Tax=Arundo donax TaxID=35708 RepID=A0A0A8ZH23_ARUDO